jgi:pyrroloquinoline-quinone synthase
MTFTNELKDKIANLNLLNHPFYQSWMRGELTLENLKHYTVQYYPHVKAFPRFVSAVHSQCDDIEGRRFLLENLNDEEGLNGENHPELWKQFGEGLGLERPTLENSPIGNKANALVEQFWKLCRSSYPEGLAALFAYEYQVPEIAKLKISGLMEQYAISDAKTLSFFKVHESADVYHSAACAKLLDGLPENERTLAMEAAQKAASALWDFLTEVHGVNCA